MQTQAQSIRCWSRSLRRRAARSVEAGKRLGVVLLAGTLFAGAFLTACTMPPDVRANYTRASTSPSTAPTVSGGTSAPTPTVTKP